MVWRVRNPFKKAEPHTEHAAGALGWGAPLAVVYSKRPAPVYIDNAANEAYETYLSPVWTPIGGGIPNKRDIGTAPPAYARQGVLVVQVGSPGILAGAFVSGPLTNVSADQSIQPVPGGGNSFAIPPR